MIIKDSELRNVVRQIISESDEGKTADSSKPDPEMREDRVRKREMMHRIFLDAVEAGSKIPLLIAIQAVSETKWGDQTVQPNNVLNIKDPKKIAEYKKLPAKTRKRAMQYRIFSSLKDCIKYYVENIEPRVLGVQTDYEKEKGLQPANKQTDPSSTTISSLMDNLAKIGYAENPSYKQHMQEVVSGPTAVVKTELPNSSAVAEYKKKYTKEIEAIAKKYGYVLK